MREVRVEWEGPYPIKQVYGMCASNDGPGLYQIYGRHVIYGSKCLLYIGRTEDTFGKRVRSNYADWKEGTPWYQNDNQVSVRIARGTSFGNFGVLADVEAFEIFCHSPAFNSSNIGTYWGQALTIFNEGDRGNLLPRISTAELTHYGVGVREYHE